ncbi:hypothetical protein G3573_05590 [Caulobacter sp. 17J65-9]|nr:hypothetical protein [Caulobacter sp. 17J65-9]
MSLLLAAGAPSACARPENAVAAVWWIGPREVRQGESVTLDPAWTSSPGAFEDIPQVCIKWLRSSAPAYVRIARDGRSVRVSADAPPGLIVTLKAKVGTEVIEGKIRVVGTGEGPLAGTRRQTAVACEGGPDPSTPVGELKFTAAGEFAVTWQPFEVYRDYWGTYVYDAATRRLTMNATDGNNVPAQLDLDGEARLLDDGSLALSGLWLGEPTPGAARSCNYTFGR